MDNLTKPREQWGSRVGFLLAAVGSAVGLGNIWRFPSRVGAYGGAAYLFIYILIVALIGVTVMLAELTIGRKTQLNPVGAFRALSKKWAVVGYLGVIAGFVILSFYSVVGGWTIGYIVRSLTGAFAGDGVEMFMGLITNPIEPLIWHLVFMACTVGIVFFGVRSGIEKISKILMPALFIMLVLIIIRSLTLPGAGAGVAYYLRPDFSKVTLKTVVSAVGQAFFSLSLGMGAMITYGSYLKKDEDLIKSAAIIPALDTFIAFIAGLAILPAVFALGANPGEGAGLAFITLPGVFNAMPLGGFFGFLFFVLLFFAALTSAISLLEVVTAYTIDQWKWSRQKTTIVMGGVMFFIGVLCSLSYADGFGWLTFRLFGMELPLFDWLADWLGDLLLIVGALLTCIFIGWVWTVKSAAKEITHDGQKPFMLLGFWGFLIKFVCPLALVIVLLNFLKIIQF